MKWWKNKREMNAQERHMEDNGITKLLMKYTLTWMKRVGAAKEKAQRSVVEVTGSLA
jgi:hypothetical protein